MSCQRFLNNGQRFYNSPILSDLTVRFSERAVKAHKVVLCAQSGWFRNAFEGNFEEASKSEIELLDDDADALDGVLRYCYGLDPMETVQTQGPVSELLSVVNIHALAEKYDILPLRTDMNERFKNLGEQHWESLWLSDDISQIIDAVFASNPSPSQGIRATAVELSYTKISNLRDKNPQMFYSILEETPNFAADLVIRMMEAQIQLEEQLKVLATTIPPHKTELHCCAERGETNRCRELLARGVSVDMRDENGETPLHFAVYFGHMECARLLVDNGADINASSHAFLSTPLRWARHTARVEIETYLLSLGATD